MGYSITTWHWTPDTWEHEFNFTITKYLLKDGTQIKTVSNDTLIDLGTEPTEEMFLNQGVDDPNIFLNHLTDNSSVLVYTTDLEVQPTATLTGIQKENYYRYKCEIDDTSTPDAVDNILVPMTDWVAVDSGNVPIIPAGYINKMNPYNVKVTVEQFDGTIITATGEVLLYNTAPFIFGNMSGNRLFLTLGDNENDRIQYQILLNGTRVYPTESEWSEQLVAPYDTTYIVDSSQVLVGQNNTIVINVKDEFGLTGELLLTFIGDYYGLMFIDGNGNYYSSDKGDILQYLDFGIIMAGHVSEPQGIVFKNTSGYDVANAEITVNKALLPPGTDVQISLTNAPFTPIDKIVLPTFNNGDSITFYVRILTEITAETGGTFELLTTATPV